MKILSQDEVLKMGTEFTGNVCYDGKLGQQIYTDQSVNGGIPLDGVLFEKYSNGVLQYYSYYNNGIPNGQRVTFYESGKIKSCCVMNAGTVDGEKDEWYENGNLKRKEFCKYGFVLCMQEFDELGNIVCEKKELNDGEKIIYEKRLAYHNCSPQ